jgi:thiamine pyrophosphokinase
VITATVFLNGDYSDPGFDRRVAAAGQILLAADGGAARLAELGLRPDAVVGDLDSLPDEVARHLTAEGVPLVRFPVRKDQTDAELAVDHAAGLGAGRVVLTGALGGMLDHELGHIAVLRRLAQDGIVAELVAPALWATVLCAPAELSLAGVRGRRFSLQALTDEVRVSLEGFDYPLNDHPVRADTCLGLGNLVVADEPRVVLRAGQALVMVSGDGSTVEAWLNDGSRASARRKTGPG